MGELQPRQILAIKDSDEQARKLVELHRLAQRRSDEFWLLDAQVIYLFATLTYEEGGIERPLWQKFAPDPNWGWCDFSVDILGMSCSVASNMKRVWEAYAVRLGWSMEEMARCGRSKLVLASAEVLRSIEEGEIDEDLIALVKDGSWYEVWDYVRAKKRARQQLPGLFLSVTESLRHGLPCRFLLLVTFTGEEGREQKLAGEFVWSDELTEDELWTVRHTVFSRLKVPFRKTSSLQYALEKRDAEDS